jgi:hypothetical protein
LWIINVIIVITLLLLSVFLLRQLVPAVRQSPVTLKVVPKAACDFEIVLKAGYVMHTRKNRPKTAKESLNRNSDAACGTIFRISTLFSRKQAET